MSIIPALAVIAVLTISSGSAAEILLPSTALERDAAVMAAFRLGWQATGKGKLQLTWTDALGRAVEDRWIPVDLTDEQEVRFPLDVRKAVAMINDLKVHLTLNGVNKKGEAAHVDETATVRFVAKPAPGWNDYEIIMWQNYDAATVGALKKLGITAGQYSGRNEKVPEFLLNNDLRWYAENIATDYYAEYHRWRPDRPVEWSFRQAKELYAKNPAGKEAFYRHPSFSDPAWREKIRTRLMDAARRWSPYRPIFYDLADESGIADLAGFWDFDFSEQSLVEMREWLKQRYGTLAALNRQWGTSFDMWDHVTPDTTNEAMKKPGDNFSAWADHKEWMDVSFERALRMGVDAIHAVDPRAFTAIAGGQMPGWGGYDYSRLSRTLTAIEPYDIGNNIEILRSLNPGMPFLTTSFARGGWEQHRLWYELLHGAHGHIIWDEKRDVVGADGSTAGRGQEQAALFTELRSGLGALLIQSVRQSDPIAIHYSQASMRTDWMLKRRPEGDAWVTRTSATERKDSDFLRLRESYCKLIEDLGYQYNFVAYGQVEDGELLKRGYRVLILPHSSSLSTLEAERIREFVAQGGTLIVDGDAGTFDEHSRRLDKSSLEAVLQRAVKMDALPYHQQRLMGKEDDLHQAADKILRDAGLKPEFTLNDSTGVEIHRFRNGGVTLVGVLTNPELRVDELGPPEFRSNERFEKQRSLRLTLPGPRSVVDVRTGRSLGVRKQVDFTLQPYEPLLLAISDEPLPALRATVPQRVARGEVMRVSMSFDHATPAATHVFHVEVRDPAGRLALPYSANTVASGGAAVHAIPIALNDAPGRWQVRVKDVMSGQEKTVEVEVN